MSEIHAATNGAIVLEVVSTVLRFIRQRETYATNQAAMLHPNDPVGAARHAIYEITTSIQDDLQVDVAVVLAAAALLADAPEENR